MVTIEDAEFKVFNLKPIGSMIQHSEITKTNYHVIKFYTRIKFFKRDDKQGFEQVGFESVEKHPLGECKHCKIPKEC